jgi:hypothetical protein
MVLLAAGAAGGGLVLAVVVLPLLLLLLLLALMLVRRSCCGRWCCFTLPPRNYPADEATHLNQTKPVQSNPTKAKQTSKIQTTPNHHQHQRQTTPTPKPTPTPTNSNAHATRNTKPNATRSLGRSAGHPSKVCTLRDASTKPSGPLQEMCVRPSVRVSVRPLSC